MFGLHLCASSLGLDVLSDMLLLGNDTSSLELSGLSLDVLAVAVRAGLGSPIFGCAA